MIHNEFGQPIGNDLPHWSGARAPERVTLAGRYCSLEPLDAATHASALFDAYAAATDTRDWTYMTVGPFASREEYLEWAREAEQQSDPLTYAVVQNATGLAVGTLSLMRQVPAHGVVEVGSVAFSPALARTRESTEAQFLLMRYAFDELGYRRFEWKCHSLNEPSRRAATRLGFTYEGLFRQAMVTKGRNRDTAWFSLLDSEWPAARDAFEAWLDPANFDAAGTQIHSLEELRAG